MMKKALLPAVLATSLLLSPSAVLAFETDQFNLPPVPLADVGDEVTEYVQLQLELVVDELNADIERHEKCIESRTKGCDSAEKEREKLAKLHSHAGLAEAVYERLAGGNLMTTKFGKWMNSHEFRSQPARYKAPYSESIYALNPFNYATLSPTVHLYGQDLGIDKLEHLFQQGYQYFKIYNEELAKGQTSEKATQKAIQWGQKTERTYYGLMTSGVYSNADMFANYVGMKFYHRLGSPITIGSKRYEALFEFRSGRWQGKQIDDLLKPFVGEQMNEALNPSSYRLTLIRSVKRSAKKTCSEWESVHPGMFPARFADASEQLHSWNGEDYGFTARERTVNLAEICTSSAN